MTGVVTPHLGVGATAGDEECWELFKDLYYPIIKEWHGYDAETQVQKRRKTEFRCVLYFVIILFFGVRLFRFYVLQLISNDVEEKLSIFYSLSTRMSLPLPPSPSLRLSP
jgi:ATP:guanido phosphotransferase, N-terminal domain